MIVVQWTASGGSHRSKTKRFRTPVRFSERDGARALLATLDKLRKDVIGEARERQRHEGLLRFLRRLADTVPEEFPLHLIVDNYGTGKYEKVKPWLKRHPRFRVHFVPTTASWPNLVEGWFGA